MATQELRERSKRNLLLPETGRIAALLADLMPGVEPTETPATHEAEAVISAVALAAEPQAAEFQVPDLPATPRVPLTNLVPQTDTTTTSTAAQLAPALTSEPVVDPDWPDLATELARRSQPVRETPAPSPAPTNMDTLRISDMPQGDDPFGPLVWNGDAELCVPPALVEAPVPAQVVAPVPAPVADADFIPLGELTTAAYFALVNWHNRPDRGRHPRLSDFGLDDASLALAKVIPFYVVGQPRVPDKTSVAAVLSEVAWE